MSDLCGDVDYRGAWNDAPRSPRLDPKASSSASGPLKMASSFSVQGTPEYGFCSPGVWASIVTAELRASNGLRVVGSSSRAAVPY